MKILKTEQEYRYEDFHALQCGHCRKKLWDLGSEIIGSARIICPQCAAVFSFEPIRWRVLADTQGK